MSCTRVLAAVLLIGCPIVSWGRVAPRYLELINAESRAANPQDYYGIDCGAVYGTCPEGQCCSESGFCGTGVDYCKSPQCQMQYSQGTCDGRYVRLPIAGFEYHLRMRNLTFAYTHRNSQRPCGSDTLNVPRSCDSNVPTGELAEFYQMQFTAGTCG
jgi:hypothetical protein